MYAEDNKRLIWIECLKITKRFRMIVYNEIINNYNHETLIDKESLKLIIKYYLNYYREQEELFIEEHYGLIHFVQSQIEERK